MLLQIHYLQQHFLIFGTVSSGCDPRMYSVLNDEQLVKIPCRAKRKKVLDFIRKVWYPN